MSGDGRDCYRRIENARGAQVRGGGRYSSTPRQTYAGAVLGRVGMGNGGLEPLLNGDGERRNGGVGMRWRRGGMGRN